MSEPISSNAANEFSGAQIPAALREWRPEIAIVLGSGLAAFVERLKIAASISFNEIAGLPISKVPGHAGRFVCAEIAGCRAIIAQGRAHLYENFDAREVAANVRFFASLGVTKLILTNAAGTLNASFAPGSWMMLADHLNLTGTSPLLGGAHFFDMSEIYSLRLRRIFARAAQTENITLHEGVYAGMLGPQYETPAEIHMLRVLGADAVGMSTVIEAIQARALGIEVAAFSCLTNWAAGLGKKPLSHAEVLDAGQAAAEDFAQILKAALTSERAEIE